MPIQFEIPTYNPQDGTYDKGVKLELDTTRGGMDISFPEETGFGKANLFIERNSEGYYSIHFTPGDNDDILITLQYKDDGTLSVNHYKNVGTKLIESTREDRA